MNNDSFDHLWVFTPILGTDDEVMAIFAPSLEECHKLDVFTQLQAVRYIGSKIRRSRGVWGAPRRSRLDEARDWLATTLLAHIPVPDWSYHCKVFWFLVMIDGSHHLSLKQLFNCPVLRDNAYSPTAF